MKKRPPRPEPQRKNIAALPAANGRERKSVIGSIGSRTRRSTATNATESPTPATSASTTSGEPQPTGVPRTNPPTRAHAPTLAPAARPPPPPGRGGRGRPPPPPPPRARPKSAGRPAAG